MNIFITDSDPVLSAQALDNKRVIKMVLESTQLLCTAINEYGGKTPYKTTHLNHPCTIWARQNQSNWLWLYEHARALCAEYTVMYGRAHKCENILSSLWNSDAHKILRPGSLAPFANCAAHLGKGISYKHVEDVPSAYKAYLVERWNTDVRIPTWREVPNWLKVLDNGKFSL